MWRYTIQCVMLHQMLSQVERQSRRAPRKDCVRVPEAPGATTLTFPVMEMYRWLFQAHNHMLLLLLPPGRMAEQPSPSPVRLLPEDRCYCCRSVKVPFRSIVQQKRGHDLFLLHVINPLPLFWQPFTPLRGGTVMKRNPELQLRGTQGARESCSAAGRRRASPLSCPSPWLRGGAEWGQIKWHVLLCGENRTCVSSRARQAHWVSGDAASGRNSSRTLPHVMWPESNLLPDNPTQEKHLLY